MSLKLDKVDIKKIAKELIFICLGCAISCVFLDPPFN